MNTLSYTIGTSTTELQVPSSLSELSGVQLIEAARLLTGGEPDMSVLSGIQADVWADMAPFQQYAVRELFDFVSAQSVREAAFKEWKLPTIRVGEEEWHGPISNFGNVTWGEFVYADQCMIQGYYKAVVAALFRQERKDYDGETDRRIAFSTYGTVSRFGKLECLDPAIQIAIIINYRAMRSASLESVYTEIFPYHDDNTDETDEGKVENVPEEESQSQFSWTAIHRNLIGDNIQDEEKFLQLPVHTVLYRLNQLIIESKKNRKTV